MNETDKPALVQRLLQRIGNPLEWSEVDKCILLSSMLIIGNSLIYVFFSAYATKAGEMPPFDWAFFQRTSRPLSLWLATGWAAILFLALLLRRRTASARPLIYASCQLFLIPCGLLLCFTGPIFSPYWIILLTALVVLLLFFDWRPVAWGFGVAASLLIFAEFQSYRGARPYAPAIDKFPFSHGVLNLTTSKASSLFSFHFGLLVGIVGFILFIFTRWRQREEEVKEAKILLEASNTKLSKATQLIRRYVPSQLAEQIIGTGAAPEATERRVLTVFFSDIRGFTQAAEKLAPERLAALLNEYLSEMAIIAKEYGGTLDKFVGDAVMVFFGAPEPLPEKEQALRCVKMAQAMHQRLHEIGARWLSEEFVSPFEVRMGVNTGPVHVGNFGSSDRMDYTVIGHHVNLASRLESACLPGKILLSQATYELVKDEIPCQSRGEIAAKGIREPVKVWEVAA